VSHGGAHASTIPSPRPWRSALDWFEAHALFVAGIAAVGVVALALAPKHLNQDGWLALVAGRYIATHGLPQHDALGVMTHGARWIDQQWLSQLLVYGLYRLGGLALYSITYVALTMAGVGMSVAAARALGGRERHTLAVFPVAGFLYFAGSFQIRTQGFAYPLFAATLWLLATEARSVSGSRRAYLVFPLLVLWGNLHGSATIGAGLAMLYGATLLVEDVRVGDWRRGRVRVRGRTVLFLFAPVVCLFVTPYGTSMVTYYHDTLLNPAFSQLVTEWQPVTSIMALAIPFFALAVATIWLLGRSGGRTPLFDHLLLVALALAAVFAVRNITWFGLAVVALLPSSLSTVLTAKSDQSRRPAINLSLATLSLAVLIGLLMTVAAKPASWFERGYDQRAVGAVAAVLRQHPQARVYADSRYSDWLLWHDPTLAGHVAYDIRFELLTSRQMHAIADIRQVGASHQRDIVAPYGLLVVNSGARPSKQPPLGRPDAHVILDGKGVVVATTPALRGST
jgi:hypothetical protein